MLARTETLLLSFVLLTGCSTSARFLPSDTTQGTHAVAVPSSSMFQWYYKRDAFAYIRKFDKDSPNFKEEDIVWQGEVAVDQQSSRGGRHSRGGFASRPDVQSGGIAAVGMGDDKNVASLDKTEYRIIYKLPAKTIVTSTGGAPGGAIPKPLPTSGPTGGMVFQNGVPNPGIRPATAVAPALAGGYQNPVNMPAGTMSAPGGMPAGIYPNPNVPAQPAGMYPNPNMPAQQAGAPIPGGYQNQPYPALPSVPPIAQPMPGSMAPSWQGNGRQ